MKKLLLKIVPFVIGAALILSACNNKVENSSYANTLTLNPGEEAKIVETLLSLKDNTSI